jgi:exo-beta-1,3-glucanase (GH17 family)
MANIHPFFSGINVTGAAEWTLQFLTNNVVSTTTSLNPAPPIIISEGRRPQKLLIIVGWPTGSGSINSSIAGTSELEYFIPQFLSAAKNAGVKYYFFEGYDEPWKVIFNTATEHYEDTWVISLW